MVGSIALSIFGRSISVGWGEGFDVFEDTEDEYSEDAFSTTLLTLDTPEPASGSVVLVTERDGSQWPAFHTTSGWISISRWVGAPYHSWFDDGAEVRLVMEPDS